MENRRLFVFLMLSVAVMFLWETVAIPRLFPQQKKPLPQQVQSEPGGAVPAAEAAASSSPNPAENPAATDGDSNAAVSATPDGAPVAAEAGAAVPSGAGELVVHPVVPVQLGSRNPTSGYALEVALSSAGASIENIWLTDPQFRDLKNQAEQVKVVGNNSTRDRTFSLGVSAIDQQLKERGSESLEAIPWKLDSETETPEGMTAAFSYDAPDGTLRVEKTYRLPRMKSISGRSTPSFRDDPSGYTLQVDLRIVNLSDKPRELTYELQGPVGVMLENDEHTSKYRDIKLEFLSGTTPITHTSQSIVKSVDAYEQEAGRVLSARDLYPKFSANDKWTGVFRYAGVDVQFFAALVAPLDDRSDEQRSAARWIDRTYPTLVERNLSDARLSDISFRMTSSPITLQARGAEDQVQHRYAFFVGPKRRELLDPLPLAAAHVLDYGSWFGFVARGMHWVLDLFYGWGMPYVLAIVSLTVLVRGCMFPLSRKQAISAAKMKDLQPKLNELKTKFGDDKEKLARAQMELWRKHNINPVGGCVPVLFQLPVFVGLFTSLNTAVDLRLAKFLWIENLAAPDALFRLPVALPFLGYDFSILPCITVALFLAQQKMVMPPAMDEQQEAQQKMMNMMTVFFGFLFWHQPAGLCVYYVASSLWGIAERKLLGSTLTSDSSTTSDSSADADTVDLPSAGVPSITVKKSSDPAPTPDKKLPGMLQKLVDMAQEAKDNAEKTQSREQRNKKNRKAR
jgi:YidC/Oxa1 family membrane protein insertase